MLSTRNTGKLLTRDYARDLADATADPDRYSEADKTRLELPDYRPSEDRFITGTSFVEPDDGSRDYDIRTNPRVS